MIINSNLCNAMADLHVHTTVSDGKKTPDEVIRTASKNNLTAIAITDHDTVLGIEIALNEAEKFGLEIIPGVEFSIAFSKDMHILGLFVDYKNISLNRHLRKITRTRMRLIAQAFRVVQNYGIDVLPQQVKDSKHYVSLKTLSEYLLENKLVIDEKEADLLLNNIWDEWRNCLPTAKECIEMIHECNGLAVLAHAKLLNLNDDELESLLVDLRDFGLDAVELIHPKHSIEDTKKLEHWADSLGLLHSGGSDYHGKEEQDMMISEKENKNIVPYSYVEKMKAVLEEKK